jgi:hypothetical protein
MRVLLRRARNGFYYQKGGSWINNSKRGFNFGSIHRALDFAEGADGDDMELVLAFESTSKVSAVPVKVARGEKAHHPRRR